MFETHDMIVTYQLQHGVSERQARLDLAVRVELQRVAKQIPSVHEMMMRLRSRGLRVSNKSVSESYARLGRWIRGPREVRIRKMDTESSRSPHS